MPKRRHGGHVLPLPPSLTPVARDRTHVRMKAARDPPGAPRPAVPRAAGRAHSRGRPPARARAAEHLQQQCATATAAERTKTAAPTAYTPLLARSCSAATSASVWPDSGQPGRNHQPGEGSTIRPTGGQSMRAAAISGPSTAGDLAVYGHASGGFALHPSSAH